MKSSKLGSISSPASRLFEHLVERVIGIADAGHLLGTHRRQRVGGTLEEGVGHLLAQLFDEFFEALASLARYEVVVLERLDSPTGIAGLEVEGHSALGGDVAGDFGAALIARGASFVFELVDGRPLVGHDLV